MRALYLADKSSLNEYLSENEFIVDLSTVTLLITFLLAGKKTTFLLKKGQGAYLEFEEYATVDLSACQIVGDCILLAGDVCNPVVGIDVTDTEKVQTIDTQPDVFKDTLLLSVVII